MANESEPGPNQSAINRVQGRFNARVADATDILLTDDMTHRQDVAEALAITATEQRDAQDTRREGQFDHQAVVNERQTDQFDRQTTTNEAQAVTNAAQGVTNADQVVINKAAIDTLEAVGLAADGVTKMLQKNVDRARNWTVALAGIVICIIFLGAFGYMQFRSVTADATAQRQTIKLQSRASCEAGRIRTTSIKNEMLFLVTTAVGDSTNPKAITFLASYPAHLDKLIPLPICH